VREKDCVPAMAPRVRISPLPLCAGESVCPDKSGLRAWSLLRNEYNSGLQKEINLFRHYRGGFNLGILSIF
jgi:hypothetical protein